MEEELSRKDDIENAPNLSAASDATTIPVTSNSNQSPVSSNPSIADRTTKRQQTTELNGCLYVLIVKKEGDELHTMKACYTQSYTRRATHKDCSQNNLVYPGGTD